MLNSPIVQSGVDRLISAKSETDLFAVFRSITGEIGGDGIATAWMPGPTALRVGRHEGMGGWCEHWTEANFVDDCPMTSRIAASTQPFMWSDVAAGKLTARQNAVVNRARDFGLTEAVIVPVRIQGGHKGNVFVRLRPEAADQPTRAALVLLSMAFHSQLMMLEPPPTEKVSQRERDVLNWFANGKSAEDVAAILGISQATVMFHYRNAATRFGTLTRTHTVVEGIRRGVVSLD